MKNYKNQTLIWGSALIFSIALSTTVFNATNPEFNFPGITETLLIGISLLLVANSFFIGKTLTRREQILGVILLFLIGTLTFRYLFGWSDPETVQSRRCMWMPGYFAKLECLLQLPFKSYHGLRQLLFHFTALSVFIGSACLSRMSGVLRPWLLLPMAGPALIIAIGVIYTFFQDHNFSLTGYNFVLGGNWIRGKGVVANPSWLWPLLTPAMAFGLGAIFSNNRLLKGVGLALFCVCAWASISVLQKGGYLMVGVFLAVLIIVFLFRSVHKWSKKYAWLMGAIGLLGLGFFASEIAYYLLTVFRSLGVEIRGNPFEFSQSRLRMWDIAWNQSIQDNLWLGNGYGTWLREFSKLSGSQYLSYDTAHNLWVQMFFELGAIHVFAIAIILGMIVWTTLIYKNVENLSLRIGGLFLMIGFFVASMVQEIDYILPVYIQFAVFAGLCFGGTSYTESLEKSHFSKSFKVSGNNGDLQTKTIKFAWIILGIGLFIVLGAFYYASSISWGGSSFEPTQQAFNRWYRPMGEIAATPDGRRREYSIFWSEHSQFEKKSFVTFRDFPEIWIQGNAIYLKNGSKWKPNQFWYETKNNIFHTQRLVSFALHQPHGQTNSIILADSGMHSWEFAGMSEEGVKVGRWCKKKCIFLLYNPNTNNQPNGVMLQMPLPGIDENHPIRLFVKIQLISDEITPSFSEKHIKQMLKKPFLRESINKEIIFSNPKDMHPLPMELNQKKLWLISLKTDRTIIPKEHDKNSTDFRELGVRISF